VDLDVSERGLDRGRTLAVGDGGRRASHEPATADHDPLAGAGAAVGATDDHGECALEQNPFFERRPLFHRSTLQRRTESSTAAERNGKRAFTRSGARALDRTAGASAGANVATGRTAAEAKHGQSSGERSELTVERR
jgi:hypothetical protein